MSNTHTPGALRAATILWENIFQKARGFDDPTGKYKQAWVNMTADLIDRETAAPDLLAACKGLLAEWARNTEDNPEYCVAIAAIAKAEGKA